MNTQATRRIAALSTGAVPSCPVVRLLALSGLLLLLAGCQPTAESPPITATAPPPPPLSQSSGSTGMVVTMTPEPLIVTATTEPLTLPTSGSVSPTAVPPIASAEVTATIAPSPTAVEAEAERPPRGSIFLPLLGLNEPPEPALAALVETSVPTVLPTLAPASATPAPPPTLAPPTATTIPTTIPTAAPTTPPLPTATRTPRPPLATRTPRVPAPATAPQPLNLRGDLPAIAIHEWPRPPGDNGRCMHFLRNQYFTLPELQTNVARLQQLGAKWVLVVYADENVLKMAAPVFAQAGIFPVWRKMLRPYEAYYAWARDIEIVRAAGLPPYFQIYNEPNLGQEWEERDEIDEELFLRNLMQATQDVYNAGGYVGWQFIDPTGFEEALMRLRARGGDAVVDRMFFVPHPYGLNHPPSYAEDIHGALGFRVFADIFQRHYGMVPPMIAGEGGWKLNADNDARFPVVSEAMHRDYHVAVFDWFRTGTLSDGQPLPDYLFAFCPWLIAEKGDDNAWWDSFAGDRRVTIDAVSAMPPFTRQFSWER